MIAMPTGKCVGGWEHSDARIPSSGGPTDGEDLAEVLEELPADITVAILTALDDDL